MSQRNNGGDQPTYYAASDLVEICDGNLTSGVMLTYIVFSFQRDDPLTDHISFLSDVITREDGLQWLPMGDGDWYKACGLPPEVARDKLDELENSGLIMVDLGQWEGLPKRLIRVNWETLVSRINAL